MELELPDYWVGCCAGLGQGDIKRATLAEHWGHRGGGGTPSDLKSRDKLLSRWKPLLTPVPKAIPIPSSHFQTLSLTISPLSPVSQPKKTHRNQQLRAPARNSSSPAKKPLATAGSHGTASSLAGTLMHLIPPAPSCECQAETRRCYLETLIVITASPFVATAAPKTSRPSVQLLLGFPTRSASARRAAAGESRLVPG